MFTPGVRGARRAANGELPGCARPTDWKKSRRAGKEKKRRAANQSLDRSLSLDA